MMCLKKFFIKSSVTILVFMTVSMITACGTKENRAERYFYSYTIDGTLKTMSIQYFADAIYTNEPYISATVSSEGSPDWGIRVNLEGDDEYLYFYESHSAGGIEIPSKDAIEAIKINNKATDLIRSGDYYIGNYTIKSFYGVVFQVKQKNWADYQDMIIALIESAEVVEP